MDGGNWEEVGLQRGTGQCDQVQGEPGKESMKNELKLAWGHLSDLPETLDRGDSRKSMRRRTLIETSSC